MLGAVVGLDRPPHDWEGHVGFYVGRPSIGKIRLLAGNQGDMVSEADFDAGRINQYRWVTGLPIQPEWVGPVPAVGPANLNPSDR